jgi:hypothetical protein
VHALNELMKFEKVPSKHAAHTHQELMSALTVRAHRLAETIPELFKRLQIRALEKRISRYNCTAGLILHLKYFSSLTKQTLFLTVQVYIIRDEIGGVYLPSQQDRTLQLCT